MEICYAEFTQIGQEMWNMLVNVNLRPDIKYKGIRNYIQQVTRPIISKDAENNVLSQTDLILEKWKDYFCKILNISEAIKKHL